MWSACFAFVDADENLATTYANDEMVFGIYGYAFPRISLVNEWRAVHHYLICEFGSFVNEADDAAHEPQQLVSATSAARLFSSIRQAALRMLVAFMSHEGSACEANLASVRASRSAVLS